VRFSYIKAAQAAFFVLSASRVLSGVTDSLLGVFSGPAFGGPSNL
jgi:hypothetical protein